MEAATLLLGLINELFPVGLVAAPAFTYFTWLVAAAAAAALFSCELLSRPSGGRMGVEVLTFMCFSGPTSSLPMSSRDPCGGY